MRAQKTAFALLTAVLLGSCVTNRPPDLGEMSFTDEPLLGKAVWHDLITEDLDAARRFYGGLFGWSLESSTAAGGHEYVLARNGDTYVAGLIEAAAREDGKKVSRWLPYISVSDVDSAVERALTSGGETVVSPRNVGFGRVAAITDEEGAVVGLARSSIGDPDDATTAGRIGSVVWNELLAANSTEAARFYERVFGYQARGIERRGGEYILLHASGDERAGVLRKPVPEWESQWLTYFGVADPAAAARRAEALGGRIVIPPSPELREGSVAVVTDPTGAVLVLQQWPRPN
jgi:uncharacterized protein